MKKDFKTTLIWDFAPLIFIFSIAVAYRHFVMAVLESNPTMNVLITVLTLIGAYIIVFAAFALHDESVAIEKIEEFLKAQPYETLPEQPWLANTRILVAIEEVIRAGGERRGANLNLIVRTVTGRVNNKLDVAQFLVGFLIAMGLLGTFIGLLETLTGISSMLNGLTSSGGATDSQFLELIQQLNKPLSGMGIAFSASMCGLIGSLILGVMMLNTRHYHRSVESEARTVLTMVVTEISAASRPVVTEVTAVAAGQAVAQMPVASFSAPADAGYLGDFLNELMRHQLDTQDIFRRGQDTAAQITARVEGLAENIQILVSAIGTSVSEAKRLNDLLGFGPRMKETNDQILNETKVLVANHVKALDFGKVQGRELERISGFNEEMSVSLTDSQKILVNVVDQLKKVEDAQVSAAKMLYEVKENSKAQAVAVTAIEGLKGAIDRQSATLTNLLDELRTSQVAIARDTRMELRQLVRELSGAGRG